MSRNVRRGYGLVAAAAMVLVAVATLTAVGQAEGESGPDRSLTDVDVEALRDLGWVRVNSEVDTRLEMWADAVGIGSMSEQEIVRGMDIITGEMTARPDGYDLYWLRELEFRRGTLCESLPPDHAYRGGEFCE